MDGFLPGADDESATPLGRVDALDGVRCLAVFLVIFFHLGVPGLAGGFLGVDTFFVLSGFLITTLLLRDAVAHGRIDLPRFWARRMARLMPAALLLLVVVGVWSLTVGAPYRRAAIGTDLLWCLLYVGNWRFIASSSYFSFDGTTSPLLHLWSLGVEEQFYVVWPLVLATTAALLAGVSTGRHARRDRGGARRRSTTAVVIAAGLGMTLSVAAMVHSYLTAGADRAYMGTDSKVFEPLLGAVFAAALLRPRVSSWVQRFAAELMVAGLGGLILAVVVLGGEHGPTPAYYYGGAVLVSLTVVALVAGATKASTDRGIGRIFAHPVAAYLGRISYGLYLWHWPWVIWLQHEGSFNPGRAALVLAATLGSAVVSYHFLEVPLRSGRFRMARPVRILQVGAAGMAVTCALPIMLGATPWYGGINRSEAAPAQAGGLPPKLMLVGDSVPNQLFGAFAAVGHGRGIPVVNGAHGGCAASGIVTVNPDGSAFDPPIPRMPGAATGPICAGVIADQVSLVERERPSMILWWSRYEYADWMGPEGSPLRAGDPGFQEAQRAALDKAVDRLTAQGAVIVAVEPEPTGTKTAELCKPEDNDPDGQCAAFLIRLRFQDHVRQQWTQVLREKAAKDRRIRLIPASDLFCRTSTNPCDDRLPLLTEGSFPPPTADHARPDGSHFAPPVRQAMAEALLERVLAAVPQQGSPSPTSSSAPTSPIPSPPGGTGPATHGPAVPDPVAPAAPVASP